MGPLQKDNRTDTVRIQPPAVIPRSTSGLGVCSRVTVSMTFSLGETKQRIQISLCGEGETTHGRKVERQGKARGSSRETGAVSGCKATGTSEEWLSHRM